jgi:hypothetical protein
MTTAIHELAVIARMIVRSLPAGEGFALLMRLADRKYHYASNGDRADMRQTLTEWLARTESQVNTRDPGETSTRARKRLEIEARCAEMGKVLATEGHHLLLLIFEFGDKGSLAWFSSAPDPRAVVRNFLKFTERP